MPRWPTEAEVPEFFGVRGLNQAKLTLPYPWYYEGQIVKHISIHEKVRDSAARVLDAVLAIYGPDEIKRLRLDQYSGCLNVRKMRGSDAWSMHSWGIAIDFDADNNQLRWGKDRASLANDDCVPFWEAWEAEGWVSLGRTRNYDWMHVQSARRE